MGGGAIMEGFNEGKRAHKMYRKGPEREGVSNIDGQNPILPHIDPTKLHITPPILHRPILGMNHLGV